MMKHQSAAGILLFTGCLFMQGFTASMDDYTGMVFPPNHALNSRIDSLPVHANSNNFIANIGADTRFHPDFGTSWSDGGTEYQMGIPYNVVGAGQPLRTIIWKLYGDESDPGPWPVPDNPYIETVFDWRETSDGDRHMLIVDSSTNTLYETGNVFGNEDGTEWEGGCGAVFDLASCVLRHDEWTSADAAGLPIFPLLIRYDETERALAAGSEIPHAIRFTAQRSQKAYIWPARHYASSSTDENRPPMGLRFRLKSDYDISGFSPRMQVILRTFKKYGIIMSDNGGNWYFQGTHDDRWDNEDINSLKELRGRDFEAVDISPWMERAGFDPNSAAVPSGAPVAYRADARSHQHGMVIRNIVGTSFSGFRLDLSLSSARQMRVSVVDISGKVVWESHCTTAGGDHSITLENVYLPAGVYRIVCSTLQGDHAVASYTHLE